MKILHDFVLEVEPRAVIDAIARLYDKTEATANVLAELRRLAPHAVDGGYELQIERVESADPDEGAYLDVWCCNEGDGQRYGLGLSPWEEWLALRVPPALEAALPAAEIVAHSVWEMTFYDFTQEAVAETRAELERRVREIDEGKVKMIPWEEVKAELRAKFPDLPASEEHQ